MYALPVVALYLWARTRGGDLPAPNAAFLFYCILGGASQVLFTALLLWMFSFRSFAVGTTFTKLDVVLVALLGALLLGDALIAVALCALGVAVLSAAHSHLRAADLLGALAQKPTVIGLACAAFHGAATVFFRAAALALEHERVAMAAAYTLFTGLLLQTILMGAFIAFTERGQLARVGRNWRRGGAVGIAGALASICWFTAFTLQKAAYVSALGKIEVLFAFLATVFVFKEKVTRTEVAGVALMLGGILLLLLAG